MQRGHRTYREGRPLYGFFVYFAAGHRHFYRGDRGIMDEECIALPQNGDGNILRTVGQRLVGVQINILRATGLDEHCLR